MQTMKRTMEKALTLVVLGVLAFANSACAMSGKQAMTQSNNQPLQQSYAWHDGDQARQAWLDPNLIASFGGGSSTKSLLAQSYGEAKEVVRAGAVTIYSLPAGTDAVKAADRMRAAGGTYSPVFHETSDPVSSLRALPGGVVVQLPKDWSESQVDNWLKAQGLQRSGNRAIAPNLFVVDSAPGMASLELANRLNGMADVVSAQPNWWVQREKR